MFLKGKVCWLEENAGVRLGESKKWYLFAKELCVHFFECGLVAYFLLDFLFLFHQGKRKLIDNHIFEL